MNWFPLVRTVIITVISVALYLTDSGENTVNELVPPCKNGNNNGNFCGPCISLTVVRTLLMNWFPLVRTVIITVISVALYLTDSGENTVNELVPPCKNGNNNGNFCGPVSH